MPDRSNVTVYDGPPIETRMAAWIALGIGGLVFVPVGWYGHAPWLYALAVPLLVVGLVLLPLHLRISVNHGEDLVRVTNRWLGLKVRERRLPLSDILGLDLLRKAGAERERPSDTWYLRLRLGIHTYTVGKYDSRANALRAQLRLREKLQERKTSEVSEVV